MLESWKAFEEIERGEITDASFVANIWLLYKGENIDERYRDPEKFFSRTYITEGFAYVLKNSISRVFGDSGDPVILLKTTFGGGKTHTMIGIYHSILSPSVVRRHLQKYNLKIPEGNITPILAVFDGNALDSYTMKKDYGANNLWQFLFSELCKKLDVGEFRELFEAYPDPKQPPGSEILRRALLKAEEMGYAVVFLLDEIPDFVKRISLKDEKESEAVILFLDSLARAVSSVRHSLLVLSIPEVKTLSSISEKIAALIQRVGRVASPRNIVGREDAAHVLREALIKEIDPTSAIRESEAYFNVYKTNRDKFSPKVSRVDYLDRMKTYYPFHPQYVEVLYDKIASLDQFQSTRDILRLTSHVIYSLSTRGQRKIIMLSDIDVGENRIKNELFERREGFVNLLRAIETDMEYISRLNEEALERGVPPIHSKIYSTIAIFSIAGEAASLKDITLATVNPDVIPAMVESALNTILSGEVSHVHLVRVDGETRYIIRERAPWRRLVEIQADKKSYENAKSEFKDRFEEALRIWGKRYFSIVTFARSPRDIEDDEKLKLVFLDPDVDLEKTLQEMIIYSDQTRGAFRNYRNSIVFVLPNKQAYDGAIKEAKKILAAIEIKEAKEKYGLSEDDIDEITKHISNWRDELKKRAAAVYNQLAYPVSGSEGKINFEFKFLNNTNPVDAAGKILKDDGKVIEDISEEFLLRLVEDYYKSMGGEYELKVKEIAKFFSRDPERPYLLNANRVVSEKISKLVLDGKVVLKKGENVYVSQRVSVGEGDVVIPGKVAVNRGLCVEYDGRFLPKPPDNLKRPVWDENARRWIEEEIETTEVAERGEEVEKGEGERVVEETEERMELENATLLDLIEKLRERRGTIAELKITLESEKDVSRSLSFVRSLSASLESFNPNYSLSAEVGDGEKIKLRAMGEVKKEGIKEVLNTIERLGCRDLRTIISLSDLEIQELLKKLDIKLLKEKYRSERFEVTGRFRTS